MNDRPACPASRFRDGTRRGVAATEFAVCIPLFVLLTIGAIQTTDAIYLKNSLRVVAYEAVREAVKPTATNLTVNTRAYEILNARNVQGATVTVNPSNLSSASPGDEIKVTVSAPANSNTIMSNWFFTDRVITEQMVMTRE